MGLYPKDGPKPLKGFQRGSVQTFSFKSPREWLSAAWLDESVRQVIQSWWEMVAAIWVREAFGVTGSVGGGNFLGFPLPLEQMQPMSLENKFAFTIQSS